MIEIVSYLCISLETNVNMRLWKTANYFHKQGLNGAYIIVTGKTEPRRIVRNTSIVGFIPGKSDAFK